MNWISIGLAALSGVLAAIIANLIVRNPKERRSAYVVAFVIFFALLQGLSREYIFPDVNAWNQSRKAESELLEIPAFQAIKQYDPQTYENLLSDIKRAIKSGSSDGSQITGMVRDRISGLVQKRLPHASDEAVASYMNVMLTEIDELNAHGGDLCYRFLFPQQSEPFDGRKYFSKQTQEADLAALANIIKTSAENPQPIPPENDVIPKLQPIFADLATEHGDDIVMLQNPGAANVDKAKVCSMAAGLYARILKLPPSESGTILRFMLSQ